MPRMLLLLAALAIGAVPSLPPLPQLPEPRDRADAGAAATVQSGSAALEGVFGIAAGECEGGAVTAGSYFRMVNPGGSPESGPYVSNGDSDCGDSTYTPLTPGSDGGLLTGTYQPHPQPAFGTNGGGLADRITRPEGFFGVEFSTATNPTDPQTATDVMAPTVTFDCDASLTGDVRAFAAAWNRQHFNQGAPKPDGSTPSGTSGPTGTFDPATGAYTLTWSSRIQGGPFDNFTGVWHLEGTFRGTGPDACTTSTTVPTTSSTSDAPPSTASTPNESATSPADSMPDTGAPPLVAPLALALALLGAWRRGGAA